MIEVARASHALRHGRPLEALAAVSGRSDAHGDAIRGIALAQLGELDRARAELLALQGRFGEAARIRVRGANPLIVGEGERLRRELLAPSLRFGDRSISLVDLEKIRKPFVDAIRKRLGDLDQFWCGDCHTARLRTITMEPKKKGKK